MKISKVYLLMAISLFVFNVINGTHEFKDEVYVFLILSNISFVLERLEK